MDWLDLLAVQGTLKSLLQHHSSKASILWHSAFFTVQLSHPYMTTGKTIALTRRTFVGKVMSLLLNMLSRLVITFLSRSKRLLISWPQSPQGTINLLKGVQIHCASTMRHTSNRNVCSCHQDSRTSMLVVTLLNFPLWFTWTHRWIGEGNGTPLQYSCLEKPMDGGAW